MTFRGQISGGKMLLERRHSFETYLTTLPEGRWVEVEVKPVRKTRSIWQNRYYFGVVVAMIAEKTGYGKDELHASLKERFLRDRENEVAGLVRIKESSSLTTTEFTEYIEQVRQWAAEVLEMDIPDPVIGGVEWKPREVPEDKPNAFGMTEEDVEKIIAAARKAQDSV